MKLLLLSDERVVNDLAEAAILRRDEKSIEVLKTLNTLQGNQNRSISRIKNKKMLELTEQ